jgi:oligoendopeptidase F
MKSGGKKPPIKIKAANAGKLRAAAGVKKGQKIPAAKLTTLAKSKSPAVRARAVFARNARSWAKKKGQ